VDTSKLASLFVLCHSLVLLTMINQTFLELRTIRVNWVRALACHGLQSIRAVFSSTVYYLLVIKLRLILFGLVRNVVNKLICCISTW
jgi:hypothetical protein